MQFGSPWPPLRDARADLADLVWLQLIKDGIRALYRWIEKYCATAAVVSLETARVEETEKVRELAALLVSVADGHFDDLMYRHIFAEQLPGVKIDDSRDGKGFKIFESVDDRVRDPNPFGKNALLALITIAFISRWLVRRTHSPKTTLHQCGPRLRPVRIKREQLLVVFTMNTPRGRSPKPISY